MLSASLQGLYLACGRLCHNEAKEAGRTRHIPATGKGAGEIHVLQPFNGAAEKGSRITKEGFAGGIHKKGTGNR